MTETLQESPAPPIALAVVSDDHAWRRENYGAVQVWIKGYSTAARFEQFASRSVENRAGPGIDELARYFSGLDGHFATVIKTNDWAIAAVDYVRSIPLAWAAGPDGWLIDGQAERLRARLGLDEIDPDAAMAIAMAGYTIDGDVLYKGIKQLGPGEFVLFRKGEPPICHRYHCYRPWRTDKPAFDFDLARKRLAETTLAVIDAMMRSIGGRLLVVPLSAGRDSRLIVSAAHHLGYRNIRTFAYGHDGNHEAKTSKAVAERLGFDWRFVPVSVASMRRHFNSSVYREYLERSDTLQSVPFVQDLPQLSELKLTGYVPDDAVIANGNSGDFLSGNHIVPEMRDIPENFSPKARRARILKSLIDKHFFLWADLRTPDRIARLEKLLDQSLSHAGAELQRPEDDFGLYEYAEFQDRQCKYVISGQRIYEFLGHEWRLPLWEKQLLDFFEAVPLEGKANQRLFADMLDRENWGGVWRDLPVNRKTIRPNWIRPVRLLAKLACAPIGADAWHRIEKRYLSYWMENGSHSAVRNYRDVVRDRRGARHGVAWLTEQYLARHGVAYDGTRSWSRVAA